MVALKQLPQKQINPKTQEYLCRKHARFYLFPQNQKNPFWAKAQTSKIKYMLIQF